MHLGELEASRWLTVESRSGEFRSVSFVRQPSSPLICQRIENESSEHAIGDSTSGHTRVRSGRAATVCIQAPCCTRKMVKLMTTVMPLGPAPLPSVYSNYWQTSNSEACSSGSGQPRSYGIERPAKVQLCKQEISKAHRGTETTKG